LQSFLDKDVMPVGEAPPTDSQNGGTPTLDGTDGSGGVYYSGVHTAEVEFWYNPQTPAQAHRDRLYCPTASALPTRPSRNRVKTEWALMKQPGQKLVDNMGNIYTVVGSGSEPGVSAQDLDNVPGADYVKIDPPVPDSVTADR